MALLDRFTTGIGIDISQHHLRLAQVSLFGTVWNTHEIELPEGLIQDDAVLKPSELQTLIKQKLSRLSWIQPGTPAVLLLPDSRVFYYGDLYPSSLKGSQLKAMVFEKAQKEIPLPFSQAILTLSQGDRVEDQTRTTVYAVEREVIKGFTSLFSERLVRLIAVETNSKSVLRFVQKTIRSEHRHLLKQNNVFFLIDLGSSWMNASVYTKKGACLYTRSIPYKQFTHEKRSSAKLPQTIVDSIAGVIDEIVLHFRQEGISLECVLLSGVEAWDERFIAKPLSEEGTLSVIRVGDVLDVKTLTPKELHVFGACIGAGIRAATPFIYNYQHNFLS